jgi:hypothetical protein
MSYLPERENKSFFFFAAFELAPVVMVGMNHFWNEIPRNVCETKEWGNLGSFMTPFRTKVSLRS